MWDCVGAVAHVRVRLCLSLLVLNAMFRGGMIAPLLGGTLLFVDRSFPVYASVAVYLITAVCIVLLRETPGGQAERAMLH